jgi:hypothetical protein
MSVSKPGIHRLWCDRQGSMAVGFALVIPMIAAVSIAILEFASVSLDYHRAGEATRRGARLATILPPVADLSALAPSTSITCTSSGATPSCSAGFVTAPETFASMSAMLPTIAGENIEIIYSHSGLGDASTPGGVLALVQVRLSGVSHPYTVLASLVPGLPSGLELPEFSTTLLASGNQGIE